MSNTRQELDKILLRAIETYTTAIAKLQQQEKTEDIELADAYYLRAQTYEKYHHFLTESASQNKLTETEAKSIEDYQSAYSLDSTKIMFDAKELKGMDEKLKMAIKNCDMALCTEYFDDFLKKIKRFIKNKANNKSKKFFKLEKVVSEGHVDLSKKFDALISKLIEGKFILGDINQLILFITNRYVNELYESSKQELISYNKNKIYKFIKKYYTNYTVNKRIENEVSEVVQALCEQSTDFMKKNDIVNAENKYQHALILSNSIINSSWTNHICLSLLEISSRYSKSGEHEKSIRCCNYLINYGNECIDGSYKIVLSILVDAYLFRCFNYYDKNSLETVPASFMDGNNDLKFLYENYNIIETRQKENISKNVFNSIIKNINNSYESTNLNALELAISQIELIQKIQISYIAKATKLKNLFPLMQEFFANDYKMQFVSAEQYPYLLSKIVTAIEKLTEGSYIANEGTYSLVDMLHLAYLKNLFAAFNSYISEIEIDNNIDDLKSSLALLADKWINDFNECKIRMPKYTHDLNKIIKIAVQKKNDLTNKMSDILNSPKVDINISEEERKLLSLDDISFKKEINDLIANGKKLSEDNDSVNAIACFNQAIDTQRNFPGLIGNKQLSNLYMLIGYEYDVILKYNRSLINNYEDKSENLDDEEIAYLENEMISNYSNSYKLDTAMREKCVDEIENMLETIKNSIKDNDIEASQIWHLNLIKYIKFFISSSENKDEMTINFNEHFSALDRVSKASTLDISFLNSEQQDEHAIILDGLHKLFPYLKKGALIAKDRAKDLIFLIDMMYVKGIATHCENYLASGNKDVIEELDILLTDFSNHFSRHDYINIINKQFISKCKQANESLTEKKYVQAANYYIYAIEISSQAVSAEEINNVFSSLLDIVKLQHDNNLDEAIRLCDFIVSCIGSGYLENRYLAKAYYYRSQAYLQHHLVKNHLHKSNDDFNLLYSLSEGEADFSDLVYDIIEKYFHLLQKNIETDVPVSYYLTLHTIMCDRIVALNNLHKSTSVSILEMKNNFSLLFPFINNPSSSLPDMSEDMIKLHTGELLNIIKKLTKGCYIVENENFNLVNVLNVLYLRSIFSKNHYLFSRFVDENPLKTTLLLFLEKQLIDYNYLLEKFPYFKNCIKQEKIFLEQQCVKIKKNVSLLGKELLTKATLNVSQAISLNQFEKSHEHYLSQLQAIDYFLFKHEPQPISLLHFRFSISKIHDTKNNSVSYYSKLLDKNKIKDISAEVNNIIELMYQGSFFKGVVGGIPSNDLTYFSFIFTLLYVDKAIRQCDELAKTDLKKALEGYSFLFNANVCNIGKVSLAERIANVKTDLELSKIEHLAISSSENKTNTNNKKPKKKNKKSKSVILPHKMVENEAKEKAEKDKAEKEQAELEMKAAKLQAHQAKKLKDKQDKYAAKQAKRQEKLAAQEEIDRLAKIEADKVAAAEQLAIEEREKEVMVERLLKEERDKIESLEKLTREKAEFTAKVTAELNDKCVFQLGSIPSSVSILMNKIAKHGEVFIYGGWVRDELRKSLSLKRDEKYVDIELIFGGDITALQSIFHEYNVYDPRPLPISPTKNAYSIPVETGIEVSISYAEELASSAEFFNIAQSLRKFMQTLDFTINRYFCGSDGRVYDALKDLHSTNNLSITEVFSLPYLETIREANSALKMDPTLILRTIFYTNALTYLKNNVPTPMQISEDMRTAISNNLDVLGEYAKKAAEPIKSPARFGYDYSVKINAWAHKLLCIGNAKANIELMEETGVLTSLFPDLAIVLKEVPYMKSWFMEKLTDIKHKSFKSKNDNINYLYALFVKCILGHNNVSEDKVNSVIENNILFKKCFLPKKPHSSSFYGATPGRITPYLEMFSENTDVPSQKSSSLPKATPSVSTPILPSYSSFNAATVVPPSFSGTVNVPPVMNYVPSQNYVYMPVYFSQGVGYVYPIQQQPIPHLVTTLPNNITHHQINQPAPARTNSPPVQDRSYYSNSPAYTNPSGNTSRASSASPQNNAPGQNRPYYSNSPANMSPSENISRASSASPHNSHHFNRTPPAASPQPYSGAPHVTLFSPYRRAIAVNQNTHQYNESPPPFTTLPPSMDLLNHPIPHRSPQYNSPEDQKLPPSSYNRQQR